MLNFRNWFEQDWAKESPKGELPANESEIGVFIDAMANPALNEAAVNANLYHRKTYEVRYESKPISDNLLTISSPMLRKAKGVVTNIGEWNDKYKPLYAFFVEEAKDAPLKPGNLLIRSMPSYFDEGDKLLLNGIIRHELRHAVDWINPNIQVEATSHYVHDTKRYAKNIGEARAHAEQLKFLMKQVGDVNKVIRLLRSGSEFRMNDELMPYAISFLKTLTEQTFTQPDTSFPQPPAIVRSISDEAVAHAASLIAQIVVKMQFHNFVEKV